MIAVLEHALIEHAGTPETRFVHIEFDKEAGVYTADLEIPQTLERLTGEGPTLLAALADLEHLARGENIITGAPKFPETEDEIRAHYAKKKEGQ